MPVIVIDPGHGGIDPGAAALSGVYEKDLILSFAQLLKRKLDGDGRYRVLMTREQDVFISLGDRVKFAPNGQGRPVHLDPCGFDLGRPGCPGPDGVYGVERASDAESARLADRENRADSLAGVESGDGADDVMDILPGPDPARDPTFSHGFASRLVGELDSVARLNKNPRREAGFRVLRAHDVPSVLVELGYLSSRQDLDLITSDEWRGGNGLLHDGCHRPLLRHEACSPGRCRGFHR